MSYNPSKHSGGVTARRVKRKGQRLPEHATGPLPLGGRQGSHDCLILS